MGRRPTHALTCTCVRRKEQSSVWLPARLMLDGWFCVCKAALTPARKHTFHNRLEVVCASKARLGSRESVQEAISGDLSEKRSLSTTPAGRHCLYLL